MVEAGLSFLVLVTFLLGSVDLSLLSWQYITMSRAVNITSRCKALDQNEATCKNIDNFISSNTFGISSITIAATNTCSSSGGGIIVEYTGTLNYSPIFIVPLRGSYRTTLCLTRQY